ncbi:MAG: NADH-quinone oxidoreductase subunit A [Chloroflexi bacterium]|nr:NADH-quinone oxidoreductase subunit A [Chloroflexota bacterium]
MPAPYLPIAVLFWVCAAMVVVILALSRLLGPQKPSQAKLEPYESGIRPEMSARRRFPVRFSLVAMLFILFDIEIVFLYPWAVVLRQLKLFALLEMLAFVLVLLVGYFYVWKKGAFDWE